MKRMIFFKNLKWLTVLSFEWIYLFCSNYLLHARNIYIILLMLLTGKPKSPKIICFLKVRFMEEYFTLKFNILSHAVHFYKHIQSCSQNKDVECFPHLKISSCTILVTSPSSPPGFVNHCCDCLSFSLNVIWKKNYTICSHIVYSISILSLNSACEIHLYCYKYQ